MSNYVEKQQSNRWNNQTGWRLVRTFEGPGSELNVFIQTELPAGYVDLDLSRTLDGWMTVAASYATAQRDETRPPGHPEYGLISRKWSKHNNVLQSPLHAHPNTELLRSVDPDWPMLIQLAVTLFNQRRKTWLEEGATGAEPIFTLPSPRIRTPTVVQLDLALEYSFLLRLNEDLTYDVDQPVLRKVETVTEDSSVRASHINVGHVYSYAALLRAEPTLPAATLIVASGLTDWHWLKKGCETDPSTGGTWQINQEYWGVKVWWRYIHGTDVV